MHIFGTKLIFLIFRHCYDKKLNLTRKVMAKVTKTEVIQYQLKRYDLIGFSEHLGETVHNGHYRSFLEKTHQQFDDLGGNEVDDRGVVIPLELTLPDEEDYADSKEQGYVYLYKK